ncbi:MAG: FAD-dependent oxidoreductase [Limimaricola sp.]|uniref:NAD(P)/FAD-dependent oxidoreductase n=1 Tax=Limimaricola sp. TaxID=2211665 RepID=UPI001D92170D|nr:FAD-binding oxidoreductase [Limimaricola sp.]MBI1416528.1 FAD-dependent oxidoreductase [Limimaricola sp.]
MTALTRNDRPGAYPPSWYAATAQIAPERAPLQGAARADVCVVGAGFTGLHAALTLAEKGLKVIVLEAHRAGWGASGRNGGQVGSGFHHDQRWIEAQVGRERAHALWALAEEGKAMVRDFCAAHAPEARFRPGIVSAAYSASEAADLHRDAAHLAEDYAYPHIAPLDRDEIRALVQTPLYHGGWIDRDAGHVHPLRYVLALAARAEAAGVTIHERSTVTGIAQGKVARVRTEAGEVVTDHVILAGNGYLPGLDRGYAARVLPFNSFIAATEPLGDLAPKVLAEDVAVFDSRWVVNYYRLSEDGRMLFGGRAAWGLTFPKDITSKLHQRMVRMFPQLAGAKVSHGWGGTLGITRTRLPVVMRVGANIVAAGGYSGHGVALAGLAGRVMAEAVAGQAGRFDALAALPSPPFPGGAALRSPLMLLGMGWFSLRDKLGV